jgi:hypothetical protein
VLAREKPRRPRSRPVPHFAYLHLDGEEDS